MRKINLFLIIFGFLHLLAFKGFSQSSVCLNDTIYLELPAFRGNIQWQESTDSLNWTDISGANYQPFAFPAVETKFYRAVITEGSCYPIYSDVRKIIVLGLPQNVSATATPNPVCEGSSLVLSGSGLGATTWSWSGPNGFTSTVQNPEISSVTTAASGIYTLT
ncbi:MAG: immunoglobulin domain-containing protein [Bacteroidetes bacterium]|nr:immunoglobulin domain-containing protein [Bacteroidota bacterium]